VTADAEAEAARVAWEEGLARLSAAGAPRGPRQAVVSAVTDELRRRVGVTFTTGELAECYRDASSWYLDLVQRVAPRTPEVWDPAVALDAAFGLYARRASDRRA
jgi:hypothetical protein